MQMQRAKNSQNNTKKKSNSGELLRLNIKFIIKE